MLNGGNFSEDPVCFPPPVVLGLGELGLPVVAVGVGPLGVDAGAGKRSGRRLELQTIHRLFCIIMMTRAFSWLKAPTSTFTFKALDNFS